MHIAITGAAGGIGAALAKIFDDKENRLTLVDLREADLFKLKNEVKTSSHIAPVDLSDIVNCCNWVHGAIDVNGPIDILINNAGITYTEPAVGVSPERIDRLMNVNLIAPLHLMHHIAPAMIERGAGVIVNVGSGSQFIDTEATAHYSASKAGLGKASEIYRKELARHGVRVLPVYLGPVETPMNAEIKKAFNDPTMDRLPASRPADVALAIKRAIEKKSKRLIYPGSLRFVYYFPNLVDGIVQIFGPKIKDN